MKTALLAALLATTLMLGATFAQHDHGGMVATTAGTTVTLQITPDTVSGFNLHLVTTGFRFAPERIGGDHVDGEGHAHLSVGGHDYGRIYGAWHHLTLPPGDHEITVTLMGNAHQTYAYAGDPVADTVAVSVAGGAMDDEHAGHDMGAMDDDEHAGHDMGTTDYGTMMGMPGNLIPVGSLLLELEPLLDASGAFRMALSTLTEEGPAEATFDLTVTDPEGSDVHLHGDHSLVVAELGQLKEGVWRIGGSIDGAHVHRSVSIVRSSTELDSDVVAIFTPTPTIEQGGGSELFLYVIAEGENVHSRFVLDAFPADDMPMGEGVDLVHDHFMDAYNTENFTPMTNTVTLTLDTAGLWNFQLTVMGGFTETADFDLVVE